MASGPGFMNRSKDPRLTAYSAVRQVGKGSYGEVFLVQHLKEKKQVCLCQVCACLSMCEFLASSVLSQAVGNCSMPKQYNTYHVANMPATANMYSML